MGGALAFILTLLLIDLLVIHRKAHVISTREAAIESSVWIGIGLCFTFVMWAAFGGAAAGEYLSGYLIEESLSIDNVFVWALILSYFAVPREYQHRVLFWGIFGALVLRATFIFAGIALIQRFEFVLIFFGAFLLYTAWKLVSSHDQVVDPENSRLLKFVRRVVPSTPEYDGAKLFTRIDGRRLATPLFAVLLLVEATDVVFAVDSVPAVLAVSHEQFIVFSSNAFAILGLRSLYFLLAGMHARFSYLQQGLAVILAFVGCEDDPVALVPHRDLDLPDRDHRRAGRLDPGVAAGRAPRRHHRHRATSGSRPSRSASRLLVRGPGDAEFRPEPD